MRILNRNALRIDTNRGLNDNPILFWAKKRDFGEIPVGNSKSKGKTMKRMKRMEPKMSAHGVIRMAIAAGVLSAAWLSLTVAAQAAENAEALAQQAWRKAIAQTEVPAAGCFHASYPSLEWNKVECVEAPHIPLRNPSQRTGPLRETVSDSNQPVSETVGDGYDYVAEVSSGLISKTIGSFPKVKGVTSETGEGVSNSYSLQLNSNFMNTATCDGASNPPQCLDWLQYAYVSTPYEVAFMQYWLINWNNPCPAGWFGYGNDCYTNSAGVNVPQEGVSELKTIKLSGSAVADGLDTLVMTVGKEAYSTTGEDSVVYLATAWTESEFNIFGPGGGSEAIFNTGSSITVKVAVTNGTKNAPVCVNNGTTGETNNLNLGPCAGKGGAAPYIKFTESN